MEGDFKKMFAKIAVIITIAAFLFAIGLIAIGWYLFKADMIEVSFLGRKLQQTSAPSGTISSDDLLDADDIGKNTAESDIADITGMNEDILQELNDIDAEFDDSTLGEIDDALTEL